MNMIVNSVTWSFHNDGSMNDLGFIPEFVSYAPDNAPLSAQINDGYAHGGGWRPFGRGKFVLNKLDGLTGEVTLKYPGDTPMRVRASATVRNERIFVFDSAIVAIVQKDNSFEVARLD